MGEYVELTSYHWSKYLANRASTRCKSAKNLRGTNTAVDGSLWCTEGELRHEKETLFNDEEIVELADYQGNEPNERTYSYHGILVGIPHVKINLASRADTNRWLGFAEKLFNEHAMKMTWNRPEEKLR